MIDLLPLVWPVSGSTPAPPISGMAAVALAGVGDGVTGITVGMATPSFVATFDRLHDARDPTVERSALLAPSFAPLPTLPRDGQEPAADGNNLPAGPNSDDGQPDTRSDNAPVWFPTAVPSPLVAAPPLVIPSRPSVGESDAAAAAPLQDPASFVPSVKDSAESAASTPGLATTPPPDATPRTRTRTTGRFAVAAPPAAAVTPSDTSATTRPADRRAAAKERKSTPVSEAALAAPAAVPIDMAQALTMPVQGTGDPARAISDVATRTLEAPMVGQVDTSRQAAHPALRFTAQPAVTAAVVAPAHGTERGDASAPGAVEIEPTGRPGAPLLTTKSRIAAALAPDIAVPASTRITDPAAPVMPTRSFRGSGGMAREAPGSAGTSDAAAVPVPIPTSQASTAPDMLVRATAATMDEATFVLPAQPLGQPGVIAPDVSALVPMMAPGASLSPDPTFILPTLPATPVTASATRGSSRAPDPIVPTQGAGRGVSSSPQPALQSSGAPALAILPIALSQNAPDESIVPSAATLAPPPSPVTVGPDIRTARSGPTLTRIAAQPQPAITVSATPQPAGRVFAAAFATAAAWRVRAPAHDLPDAAVMAAAPVAVPERIAVTATAAAQGTPLDLTRDSGLERMIDRIELLRDAASDAVDASDTRIRLIPDALGSVDIAVRQEGDRVHVRFTAEQEATRALIANAQPRLTDLAAARGVRIGETSVSGGSTQTASGNGATPQPRLTPQPAPQPTRAPRSIATDTTIITDHRLA